VAGDVEAAAEGVDDARAVEEPERRQGRVVADAGMPVLDREMRALVIGRREGHQQRRDQLEPASEVIDVIDFRQGHERLDGSPRRLLLERGERGVVVRAELATAGEVQRQRQHGGLEAAAGVRRRGEEGAIARVLFGGERGERVEGAGGHGENQSISRRPGESHDKIRYRPGAHG
jgi:hypothetical protein